MTIAANHIVALSPTPEETDAAVRYAIKSAVPYTYDRMEKDAWRRVARVARGKVNEAMMRRFAAGIGIKTSEQEKSHQQHDSFDFAFTAKRGVLQADIKTFHVLTQFLGQSREPFNISDLLCGENHSSGAWHRFFPMLVPQDYPRATGRLPGEAQVVVRELPNILEATVQCNDFEVLRRVTLTTDTIWLTARETVQSDIADGLLTEIAPLPAVDQPKAEIVLVTLRGRSISPATRNIVSAIAG
ncbi:MAG: hypothetical protein M0R03_15000 [Novosphingobium sp.]|nr:hypothetical protein [Novosphingobium sp.]